MDIFLTGGTGYVGGAVLRALVEGGHAVRALVRREAGLSELESTGRVRAVVGDLARPETYAAEAGAADAIVHCALQYGADGEEVPAVDATAVETFLAAAGPSGHLVYTSSLFEPVAGGGFLVESAAGAGELGGWRGELEGKVLGAGAATAVVRLGFVYGGRGGYLWDMLAPGPDGRIRYVAPGTARWPFVDVEDVAALYRLIVERRARGVFHAAAGAPVPVADVVRVVGGLVGAPAEPVGPEEAAAELGAVGTLMLRDVEASTERSRGLGWRPRRTAFSPAAEAAYRASRERDRS